jgi:predicted amidophosphoribosyltransferase
MQKDNQQRCPSCGLTVKIGVLRCPRCNQLLPQAGCSGNCRTCALNYSHKN